MLSISFWGIELRGLLVLAHPFLPCWVALFAAWSLLSNLTAFLLMFIQNDCRVGFWVRVIDGANFLEGRIIEMGLMNVVLEHVDGHKVIYPNNIFVTRPVIQKTHLQRLKRHKTYFIQKSNLKVNEIPKKVFSASIGD